MNVLIFDLETTGLDPATCAVIEVGWAVWSVTHRSLVDAHSFLLRREDNLAERINGISPELLRADGGDPSVAWSLLECDAERCEIVLAHQANFDRSFLIHAPDTTRVWMESRYWVCTREDFVWPRVSEPHSLVETALAHGVAVVAAHRSMQDVLMIARLLESLPDAEDRVYLALQRSRRPKDDYIAQEPFEMKDVVKAAGFRWDGSVWKRRMAVEDAEKLEFRVVRASELSP